MFNRPSLTDLVTRTRDDVLSRLDTDELLRRADAEILARVLAGVSHELHGYLDWISRQVLFDTSDDEIIERQASWWGVFRKPAEFATGPVIASGVATKVIPSGTLLRRGDGVEYLTDGDIVIGGAPTQGQVIASVAAAAGNALVGVVLTIVNPIDDVQSQVTVGAAGITNGSDIELLADFRARFIQQIQKPPSGGAASDYVQWALEVPGVTRAWVYPGEMGVNGVTVRFLRDNDASPIPDAAEVQAVFDYIETVRPVTAELTVVAPIADVQNFTITLTPGSASVKAAVIAELKDLLLREAEPGKTIFLSHIREAISIAAGEENNILTVPSADLTFAVGHIATFGSVTWL